MAKTTGKKSKHPGGRPTEYDPRFAEMAYVACSEGGFTDAKLAKLFGICGSTIKNWKKEHSEFLSSCTRGKDVWDSLTAENCLQKRIRGYKAVEVTKEPQTIPAFRPLMGPDGIQQADASGNPLFERVASETKLVVTKKVTRHIAPDVESIKFFLTNRNPSRWKLVKHVEVTGAGGGPLSFQDVDAKERAHLKALAKQQALAHMAEEAKE